MVNQYNAGSPEINRIETSIEMLEVRLKGRHDDRAEGRESGGVADAATDKHYLDLNRDRISQLRGQAGGGGQDAERVPHDLDRLPDLERRLQETQRLWNQLHGPGSGNPMNVATVAPPLTSEHAQSQRPVVLPPLAEGGGGSNPTSGIPPTLAADFRALGILDLSDRPQPGTVVKPVPPSLQTPPQGALTTEQSPLQQAALDGLRNTVITVTSLGGLTLLLYQLGYLAVGGMMYLPGSRPPWAPATPTQG